jgi:hypothetical protein
MYIFSLILACFYCSSMFAGDSLAYVSGPWKLINISNDGGVTQAQHTRQWIIDSFFQSHHQIQSRLNGVTYVAR